MLETVATLIVGGLVGYVIGVLERRHRRRIGRRCPHCHGAGGTQIDRYGWVRCASCEGSGEA
jgi:hypothetical protein